jgi:hypothetical protein
MHESILTASFDASHLHAGLLATGAKQGRPVQFYNAEGKPDFKPPTGDRIRITLRYTDPSGKEVIVPAQRWIRNTRTKEPLKEDWVFAGSFLDTTRQDRSGRPLYGANIDGRVICTSNFTNAVLDLPFKSEEGNPQGGLDYEANGEFLPHDELASAMVGLATPGLGPYAVAGLFAQARIGIIPPLGTKVVVILEPIKEK